jgi:hypothetical protein
MGGEQYESFAVSITCGAPVPVFIRIRGAELAKALKPGASPELLRKIIDASLLWYDVSNIMRKWYVWKTVTTPALDKVRQEIIKQWRGLGLEVWRSRYQVRLDESGGNKSVEAIRRLQAEVVLNRNEPVNRDVIQGVLLHVSKRLRRKRIPGIWVQGSGRIRRRPVYVWIRLHRADARIRTLESRDWSNSELLAIGEWIRHPRRHNPIIVKEPDELFQGIRIRYNPNFDL